MKKLKKVFSYSVYRKTLYAYTFSTLIIIVAILISLFAVVTSQFKKTAIDNANLMLSQLVSSSKYIKNDVDNIMSVVANDIDTLDFVRNKEESKMANYNLHKKLLQFKSPYSYIIDVSVVNFDNEISVQSWGTNINNSLNYEFARQARDASLSVITREVEFFNPNKNYRVVSFLYYLPYYNSVVIADVEADRFKSKIEGSSDLSRDIFIVDADGNPITQNTYLQVDGKPFYNYFAGILDSYGDVEEGYFVKDDSQNQQMVFFSKSEALGWWFVDVQSYSNFFDAYRSVAMIFLGIALVFLGICVVASIIFSRRIRRPLMQLVDNCKTDFETEINGKDEYKYLDQVIASVEHERYLNENYVQSLYLQSVLLGQDMPFFLSNEKRRMLQKKYIAAAYSVMVMRIQLDYEVEEAKEKEEYSLMRYTVCNLAQEIFGNEYRCVAVDLGGDLVAVLLMLDSQNLSDDYTLCFKQLKEFAADQIHINISGSLGSVVDNLDSVRFSCSKAKQYLEISGIIGKDELVDSNNTSSVSYQEKNVRLVDSVVEYAKDNYSNPDMSLKSISQMFGLSTTYLGKIFKSVKSESFSSFLTSYRLEQSKLALLETNKTINEISSEVGFANSTYYTTVFRNAYGMTPTAFRNNVSK